MCYLLDCFPTNSPRRTSSMGIYIVLIVVITIIALLMAIVILLQSGKGGGLAGIASGGQTTQILGARQAPDFLEKATWTLGTAFIVLCVLANFFASPGEATRSVIQEGGVETTAPPAIDPLPPGPGTVNEQPTAPAPPAPEEN